MVHHAGTHRLELDIALAGQEIAVLLGKTGTETPFPQRAAAVVGLVDVLDVAPSQALHHQSCTVGLL
jgi:hypothetical protein